VLGYIATFVIVLLIGFLAPSLMAKAKTAMGQANGLRGLFFVLTFFAIGMLSNFRKLWEEGIAKLAGVYLLCLFGYIIWVGLAISWFFFRGMTPPVIH
jgi:predicted Kef-type K+ transport protein